MSHLIHAFYYLPQAAGALAKVCHLTADTESWLTRKAMRFGRWLDRMFGGPLDDGDGFRLFFLYVMKSSIHEEIFCRRHELSWAKRLGPYLIGGE